MNKNTLVLLGIFLLVFGTNVSSAAINLAPNPSFETTPTIDYLTHGTGTFTWANDAVNTGSRSIKIVSNQPTGSYARWFSRINKIPGKAGNVYDASVWMKPTNVVQYGKLVINFWGASSNYLGGSESIGTVKGTTGWTQLTVQGTAPANTAYVRVEFRLYGSGTLWIDDVNIGLKTVTSTPTPIQPSTWTLLCGEEFNSAIDSAKWKVYSNYNQNGATSDTRFMSSMTTVSNGILHLGIAMNPVTGRKYIGGGLDNEYNTKCSGLTQGRWEVRAKMPKGFGTDGYIGLYGNPHKWPPEIIITENIGKRRTINYIMQIYGTSPQVQYDVTQVNGTTWDTEYHVYAFEWEGTTLRWYIDGTLKKTSQQLYPSYPMKLGMGAWSGTCGSSWPDCASSSTLPAYMDVDYVRIYERSVVSQTPTPTPIITPKPTQTIPPTKFNVFPFIDFIIKWFMSIFGGLTIPQIPIHNITHTPTPSLLSAHPNMYLNANEINAIKTKVNAGQQPWKEAYDKFMINDVPASLSLSVQSVTYGGKTPPSGDKHDYFSEPPYTTGDGIFDPNADRTDYQSAIAIGNAVRNLGVAYALTGDNKYADKAIQLINAWSVNPATKMNPKVTTFNGQAYIEVPITLTGMYYGADLIWNYQGWNVNDKNAFKSWVKDTSVSRGRSKEANPTNYENWKVLFISSSAVITEDKNDMDWAFQYWKELIPKQMNNQGQMVNELSRTRSLFYSMYAINAMTQTAEIARHRGVDLYGYKTSDGRGLELTYDYHAPYMAGKATWPYQEISPNLLEYGTYENAYSFKQKTSYMDVINKAGRPLYEKRVMGPVTLTHGK